MTNIKDIRSTLKNIKEKLKIKYGVSEIGIFGSYVKNEQDKTSDIDILVEFEKPIDLLTFVNLKYYLSELLNTNVDLVMKKALKPRIAERILKEVNIL
jgi:predicted nucleotidyltransferase